MNSSYNRSLHWSIAVLTLLVCVSSTGYILLVLGNLSRSESTLYDLPHTRVEYYPVSGEDISELKREMHLHGPVDNDGGKFFAYTRWEIGWEIKDITNGKPVPESAEVQYEIKVTLPEWEEYDQASPRLKEKWDDFLDGVIRHERGHVLGFLSGAKKLEDRLRNLDSETTLKEIHHVARATISELYYFDTTYDKRTLGGRTHGTILR